MGHGGMGAWGHGGMGPLGMGQGGMGQGGKCCCFCSLTFLCSVTGLGCASGLDALLQLRLGHLFQWLSLWLLTLSTALAAQ